MAPQFAINRMQKVHPICNSLLTPWLFLFALVFRLSFGQAKRLVYRFFSPLGQTVFYNDFFAWANLHVACFSKGEVGRNR